MSRLSRRMFLTKGSLVVAAGSVAATVPGIGSILQAAPAEAPEIEGAATEGEAAAADLSGPLVAHVTDVRSGEISFYEGERQVVYRDPSLAARLYRVSR